MISQAEHRYAADEKVQLDVVADHFVKAFREAELPFNNLLADQDLEKVRDEPRSLSRCMCWAPLLQNTQPSSAAVKGVVL